MLSGNTISDKTVHQAGRPLSLFRGVFIRSWLFFRMVAFRLGALGLLFSFLLAFFIFPRDGIAYEERCKNRLDCCKSLRQLCNRYTFWMAKRCPDTCGLCKQENLCTINKCLYHAECKAVNRVIAQCVCPHLEDCPKSPSFVCGSDKITYRNKCTLKAIACRLKLDIEVSAAGFCKYPCANKKCPPFAKCVVLSDAPKCKCPSFKDCPRVFRPICGIYGDTYYNSCHWRVKSCKTKAMIPIVSRGRCAKRELKRGNLKNRIKQE